MSSILGAPRIRNLPVDVSPVNGDYTVTADDYFIAVLDTQAPRTITLPLSADIPNGRTFVIKDETGNAGVNNITVQATNPDTIDGAANKVINSNRGSITVLARQSGYSIF